MWILLSKVPEDQEMYAAAMISSVETQAIDQNLEGLEQVRPRVFEHTKVLLIYDGQELSFKLSEREQQITSL